MKKGRKPTPSRKRKTNIILKKLTIQSTTNYKLIISENTKHIDIAGEGRALDSHRGTQTVSYGTTLYLMLSEGLMSSITQSYGTYLLTVTVALVKLQDTHAQRDLNSGRITTLAGAADVSVPVLTTIFKAQVLVVETVTVDS